MQLPASCRRRHTRYHIDIIEPVFCSLDRPSPDDSPRPVTVRNESFSGCSLIVDEKGEVEVGEYIHLNFGHVYSIEAEVVRTARISSRSLELGCRFIP